MLVPVFKSVGERSTTKDYRPINLLSVVSKIFEKHVNNRLVDHFKEYDFFVGFQYSLRSSCSTTDLLTIVSSRIDWAFNRSGPTGYIFKVFARN